MPTSIEISVEASGWAGLDFDTERLAREIIQVALDAAQSTGEVSLLLTDDAAIQILNRDFRQQDKATNVLSFPMDEPGFLGDIAIAFETVTRESEAMDVPFRDHYIHLLVHGTLHLLGYDHMTDDEANLMEELEISILAGLGIENPYARPRFMA